MRLISLAFPLNFSSPNVESLNKKSLLLLLTLLLTAKAFAQNEKQVKGHIQNEKGDPVYGVTVFLSSDKDSVYTSSDKDGRFLLKDIQADSFTLKITHIGYKQFEKRYAFNDKMILELPPIVLQPKINILDEVVVSASTPVTIKEDTVQYDPGAYKTREGTLLAELLEQIPGLRINAEGELIAHGEKINRIEVNGREFFGGDVSTALDNLPADIIKNIQVVDDYGERARLTGFKSGDPQKVLNLNTKSDRGFTGRTAAAIGDQERYLGAFSSNIMDGDREISAVGSINNTNTNPLRRRRVRFGNNGISRDISAAGNYQDELGEDLSVSGSYRYSNSRTTDAGSTISRSVFDDFTNRNTNEYTNISNNASHNINYDLEYRPNDSDFIKFSPRLDFSTTSSSNSSNFFIEQNNLPQTRISEGENNTETDAFSNNLGAGLVYFHAFAKEGRGLSIELDAGYDNQEQDRETETTTSISVGDSERFRETNQLIRTDNNSRNGDVRVSYTEPLFEHSQLELSYGLDLSERNDEQTTWDLDENQQMQNRIDSLSTQYQYNVITNRAGVSFRKEEEKYSYSLGLNLQPETQKGREKITGMTITNHSLNVIPQARFSYGESRRKRFTVRYRGSTSQPTFTQLQPVADLSDPQYPVIGNPNLKPEFTHNLNLSYRKFDFESSNMLMIRMDLRQTHNKIVSNIVNEFEDSESSVIQERHFLNTDGYYSANGHYMFNKPLLERKLSIGFDGGVNFNNNVTFLNGEKRSGADWSWNQGIRFRVDIEDVINTTLRGEYRANKTNYALSRRSNNNDLQSFRLELRGENYFFDNWILEYDFSKTFNSRIDDELNTDPLILNLALEREFLENNKASLKIEGFDLLKQNTGISRSVNGNTITNRRNNLLSRYFLVSFSLRLQNFERERPDFRRR